MHQFYSVQLYPAFRQGQIKTFIKNCEEELKEVNSKAHHLGAAWLLQFVYTPSNDVRTYHSCLLEIGACTVVCLDETLAQVEHRNHQHPKGENIT